MDKWKTHSYCITFCLNKYFWCCIIHSVQEVSVTLWTCSLTELKQPGNLGWLVWYVSCLLFFESGADCTGFCGRFLETCLALDENKKPFLWAILMLHYVQSEKQFTLLQSLSSICCVLELFFPFQKGFILTGYYLFIYLDLLIFIWKAAFQIGSGEERSLIFFCTPQMDTAARAGPFHSQELAGSSRSPSCCRDASAWAIPCCFPRHISKELDQKLSSWDLNYHP